MTENFNLAELVKKGGHEALRERGMSTCSSPAAPASQEHPGQRGLQGEFATTGQGGRSPNTPARSPGKACR